MHISSVLGRKQEYGWPFLKLSHPGDRCQGTFTSQGSAETLSHPVQEFCYSIWCWWSRFQDMLQTQVRGWDEGTVLDQHDQDIMVGAPGS